MWTSERVETFLGTTIIGYPHIFVGFSPGIPPDSHREELKNVDKSPLWCWLGIMKCTQPPPLVD